MKKYGFMLVNSLLAAFMVVSIYALLPESLLTPVYMRGKSFLEAVFNGVSMVLPVIILVMVLTIIRHQYIALGKRLSFEALFFTAIISFVLSHAGFNDSHLLWVALPVYALSWGMIGCIGKQGKIF